MKRFFLPAILLFPVASLIFWVFWGASLHHTLPTAAVVGTNGPLFNTNAAEVISNSASK